MRELLHQAIQHHDNMVIELETAKRTLAQYQKENETLLNEVAQAATKIQELEASQKHIQTVMSARVVTAAVDIVEEFSKRALNEVKDKAEAKLADLFAPGPRPKPVNNPIQQVEKHIDELKNVDVQHIEHYAPKIDLREKAKMLREMAQERLNGVTIPNWLTRPAPYKEPDSLVRRIVLAFIGG